MDREDWRADRLQPSKMRRAFEAAAQMESQGKRVIHFDIGKPDFDTPVHIKEAAKKALDEGKVGYTASRGILELREAIAAKLERDNGIRVDPETEVLVTAGAKEAVFAAMMSSLRPGDEVLMPEPSWPHYCFSAQMTGASVVSLTLDAERAHLADLDEVRDRITPRTRLLVVNSPHNPTGAVWPREHLEALAEIAIQNDLLVLSDEIYEKEVYEGAVHVSLAALPGMFRRTFTVNGFSKSFAMTGWRLGYLAAPRDLLAAAVRVHESIVTCANSFAQYGALAALEGPQECVQAMSSEFDRRRRVVIQTLGEIEGFSCARPLGAFYAFPSVSSFGIPAEDFAEFLLAKAQVATVPGTAFGANGEGFIRIAYSTSYENTVEGMERIRRAVTRLM